MNIDLSKKSPAELKKLLDSVKVSDLPVVEKDKLIDDINYKLTGKRFEHKEVLAQIEAGKADLPSID